MKLEIPIIALTIFISLSIQFDVNKYYYLFIDVHESGTYIRLDKKYVPLKKIRDLEDICVLYDPKREAYDVIENERKKLREERTKNMQKPLTVDEENKILMKIESVIQKMAFFNDSRFYDHLPDNYTGKHFEYDNICTIATQEGDVFYDLEVKAHGEGINTESFCKKIVIQSGYSYYEWYPKDGSAVFALREGSTWDI